MNNKKVYALLTRQCNLSCPHCNIRNIEDNYDADKFIDQLKSFDGRIVLFGGEPSLYEDRLESIIYNENLIKKVSSLTTNLVKLNDNLISMYKIVKYIGTSWNPKRFNSEEYRKWLDNIDTLCYNDFSDMCVLITLTPDLLEYTPDRFMKVISKWNSSVISNIRFEYLVDNTLTEDYYKAADEWMCNVYKGWDSPIDMDIRNVFCWYFDCKDIYTLYPNGELIRKCPNTESIYTPEECYTCERSAICQPCRLHKYCSFPKELEKLVIAKEGYNNEDKPVSCIS